MASLRYGHSTKARARGLRSSDNDEDARTQAMVDGSRATRATARARSRATRRVLRRADQDRAADVREGAAERVPEELTRSVAGSRTQPGVATTRGPSSPSIANAVQPMSARTRGSRGSPRGRACGERQLLVPPSRSRDAAQGQRRVFA